MLMLMAWVAWRRLQLRSSLNCKECLSGALEYATALYCEEERSMQQVAGARRAVHICKCQSVHDEVA